MEKFFSNMHFGHGEDIHGHALHRVFRNGRPLGFPLDIPIVRVAGLTDRKNILYLLDGIGATDLMDFELALHIQGLLLDPRVHHVVVPSLA